MTTIRRVRRTRTTVRTIAATTLVLLVWAALTAVERQTPGWWLLAALAAVILTPVAIAVCLRRSI